MVPPRRNRRWVWFFVVVAVLTVVAVVTLVRVNQAMQLNQERLDRAWALWKEKGPKSYVLKYTKSVPGMADEHYVVRVQGGRTVSVSLNGRPLEDRQLGYYGMDALFSDLEVFLRLAAKPGARKTFLVADFDETDGHIYRLVRSVTGRGEGVEVPRPPERVEVQVQELRPLTGGTEKEGGRG